MDGDDDKLDEIEGLENSFVSKIIKEKQKNDEENDGDGQIKKNEGDDIKNNGNKIIITLDKIGNILFFFKGGIKQSALLIVYALIIFGIASGLKLNQTGFTMYCCSVWFALLAFLFFWVKPVEQEIAVVPDKVE